MKAEQKEKMKEASIKAKETAKEAGSKAKETAKEVVEDKKTLNAIIGAFATGSILLTAGRSKIRKNKDLPKEDK